MSKVVHGGNIDEICREYGIDNREIHDFSANINPLGLNKEIKNTMIKAIDAIVHYPDITYYQLKKAISEYESLEEENIFLGNGAAEVIFNVVRATNPKKVLLPAPTFGEYEEAILSIHGEMEYYNLLEENDFNFDEGFISSINSFIDMVFICNPNNPTGVLTSGDFIEKLCEKALEMNTIVVVDESFLDFIQGSHNLSSKNLLHKFENLIIIKSLTKFFAMPGIRIGYGMCKNKKITQDINKISVPWSINTVAEKGIIKGLKEKEYIKETIEYVENEKNYLCEALKEIPHIKVFPPSVNFIMFKILKDINLKEELLKENVLIRSCSNYIGLNKNYYRVAVRTRKENEMLIGFMKKLLNKEYA